MWIILGLIAIIATFTNIYMYRAGKDYKLAMVIGLSFTTLTLCATINLIAGWIKSEDWGALLDVVPILEKSLWLIAIFSIILNITPMLLDSKKKK